MTELEKAMKETAEAAIGMLKKSQLNLDFSAPNPHDHHKEYTRVNQSGTVSHIKAKGVEVKGRKVYHNDQHIADIIGNRGRDHKGNVVVDLDVRMKDGTFLNDKLRGKWSYFADVVSDLKNNPEWLGITQSQPAPEQVKEDKLTQQTGNKTTKLIKKLKAADFSKKTDIWHDADLTRSEAEEAVKEMILNLPPGGYKLHGREYGTNLVDTIHNEYGWMPSMLVSEPMMHGLQVTHPDKVYASFTHGLDAIEIKPPKPIWDSEAAVNDTKDIKRRLVAAGFKANEWSVRAGTVTSGPRKGEIDDAKISNRYPLQHADVVARTQALLDAGFDVTWNTMVRENGQRLTVPTVYSVPRQGKVTILDADKPVGERLTTYSTQAEAEAALKHSTNQP